MADSRHPTQLVSSWSLVDPLNDLLPLARYAVRHARLPAPGVHGLESTNRPPGRPLGCAKCGGEAWRPAAAAAGAVPNPAPWALLGRQTLTRNARFRVMAGPPYFGCPPARSISLFGAKTWVSFFFTPEPGPWERGRLPLTYCSRPAP